MPSAVLVPDNQYVSAQQRTDLKFVVIFPTDEEATQNSFGFINITFNDTNVTIEFIKEQSRHDRGLFSYLMWESIMFDYTTYTSLFFILPSPFSYL